MKVELVDVMGSDASVVNAARVSYAKVAEQYTEEQNEKLIKYLAEHNHWSPFAHAYLSFRIKAPIFVARQLVKHQVGLAWNEVSRRYVDSAPEFYIPSEWRGRPVNSKQGSNGVVDIGLYVDEQVRLAVDCGLAAYNALLKQGVAPEQARMILPQNMLTEWIWSGSLYAFARVCKLRLKPDAQAETRMVAVQINDICAEKFPVSWKYLTCNS